MFHSEVALDQWKTIFISNGAFLACLFYLKWIFKMLLFNKHICKHTHTKYFLKYLYYPTLWILEFYCLNEINYFNSSFFSFTELILKAIINRGRKLSQDEVKSFFKDSRWKRAKIQTSSLINLIGQTQGYHDRCNVKWDENKQLIFFTYKMPANENIW